MVATASFLRRAWCAACVLWLVACSSVLGIEEKPCEPGCVDETTRLTCDADGTPRAQACPGSAEPCAARTCSLGECTFRPAVGAPCGRKGLARCNEGYACLGPDVRLTAHRERSCALADDGKVWCWGRNVRFGLGDAGSGESGTPVLVRGLQGAAIDVSAGSSHTCAVVLGGDIYCWGDNHAGMVDPASDEVVIIPPTLVTVPGVHFRGVRAGSDHTCGLAEDSTVYCWGATEQGQCGVDGPNVGVSQVAPTRIPQLDHVRLVETVKSHTCAIRTVVPTLVCWGSNQYVEDGGYIDHKLGPRAMALPYSALPVPVDLGSQVLDIGMGFESTYAIAADAHTYAWGLNLHGQLGTGSVEKAVAIPAFVMTQTSGTTFPSGAMPLMNVRHVLRSPGADQCAQMQDLSLHAPYFCWGRDDRGELGLGAAFVGQISRLARAASALPPSAANMAHGTDHACVTVSEGKRVEIWCYGEGGVVGNGSTDPAGNQISPSRIHWDPNNFDVLLHPSAEQQP